MYGGCGSQSRIPLVVGSLTPAAWPGSMIACAAGQWHRATTCRVILTTCSAVFVPFVSKRATSGTMAYCLRHPLLPSAPAQLETPSPASLLQARCRCPPPFRRKPFVMRPRQHRIRFWVGGVGVVLSRSLSHAALPLRRWQIAVRMPWLERPRWQ